VKAFTNRFAKLKVHAASLKSEFLFLFGKSIYLLEVV